MSEGTRSGPPVALLVSICQSRDRLPSARLVSRSKRTGSSHLKPSGRTSPTLACRPRPQWSAQRSLLYCASFFHVVACCSQNSTYAGLQAEDRYPKTHGTHGRPIADLTPNPDLERPHAVLPGIPLAFQPKRVYKTACPTELNPSTVTKLFRDSRSICNTTLSRFPQRLPIPAVRLVSH